MVFRRGREVEVHLVELELPGVNWDSMSEAYVDAEWGRTLAGLPTRLGPGDAVVLVPDQHPSRACGTGAPRSSCANRPP